MRALGRHRADARWLRERGKIERPTPHRSKAKAWRSDQAIDRLQPDWMDRFLASHRIQTRQFRQVVVLGLMRTTTIFAMAVERFVHWTEIARATEEQAPVKEVNSWTSNYRASPADPGQLRARRRC